MHNRLPYALRSLRRLNSPQDTLLDDLWGRWASRTGWNLAPVGDEERDRSHGIGGGFDLLDILGWVQTADENQRDLLVVFGVEKSRDLGKRGFGG